MMRNDNDRERWRSVAFGGSGAVRLQNAIFR